MFKKVCHIQETSRWQENSGSYVWNNKSANKVEILKVNFFLNFSLYTYRYKIQKQKILFDN